MRKKEKAITDQAELDRILKEANVLHLSMCVDNEPYVVALTYTYQEGRFYIHCAREGKKLDILRKNPRVCFQIEHDVQVAPSAKACAWTMHYKSIMGTGRAEIVEEPEKVRAGLDIFMSRFAEPPYEYVDKAVALTTLIIVHVEEMIGKQSPAPKKD